VISSQIARESFRRRTSVRTESLTVTADVARQSLYVPVVINDLLPRRSVISRRPDVDEIPSGLYERPLDRYE